MKRVCPKVDLSDDAVELLNALLMEKFQSIAEKAVTMVKSANNENLTCDDFKKAVQTVFKND